MPNNFGMKKIVVLLLISFPIIVVAQNVGIGKTDPQAKLEIKQTSNLEPTLMLSDSTGNSAGRLRFRSLFSQYASRSWYTDYKVGTYSKDNEIFLYNDSTNVMNIYGTGNITIGDAVTPSARLSVFSDNPSSDILDIMGSSYQPALKVLGNRNVGIKNPAPAEALDVTGNINVTGTIKANGVDGTANQILMKNGSGTLAWGDMCEFKNMATFLTGTNATWPIPIGTKRVWVEIWGGGASGITYVGGGGGAYLSAVIDVLDPNSPGALTYTVGTAGTGGIAGGPNLAGTATTVSYTNPAGLLLTANGGDAPTATGSPLVIFGGNIANYNVSPASFTNYIGRTGSYGTTNTSTLQTFGANTYETVTLGDGGDAGNAPDTKGLGGQIFVNLTSASLIRRTSSGNFGKVPGGGGSSGGLPITGGIISLSGSGGASGMVIFHY
jgi:hypothetical protein